MHRKLLWMQKLSQTKIFLELYHCSGHDGYCIYLTQFFKVYEIFIMHRKYASQILMNTISIINHNVLELYHCSDHDGYYMYLIYFYKVDAIYIMHRKDASQTFMNVISITNQKCLGVVSLFRSQLILHIFDWIFHSRSNTHLALKRCITNFYECNIHHTP